MKSAIDDCPNVSMPTVSVRLCNLVDPRVAIERYDLSIDQKAVLYQARAYKAKPTDSDVVRAHIKAQFSRSPEVRNDRYSKGFNALYSSESREVAEAEMRYHSRVNFYKKGKENVYTFSAIEIKLNGGEIADIRALCEGQYGLMNSQNLSVSQIAGKYISKSRDGLLTVSVRHRGSNQVIFQEDLIYEGAVLGQTVVMVSEKTGGSYTSISRVDI